MCFLLIKGTNVMEGTGQFLVTAVGINSQSGIIMSLWGVADEESPSKYEEQDQKESKKKLKN
jgi:magnesium-transporting ATPase (P-type)